MFGRIKRVSDSDYASALIAEPLSVLSPGEMAAGVYVLLARAGTDPKTLKLVTGLSGMEASNDN
ncbi:MAG: hypothetical protein AAGG72_00105 [Pseudomonadota bacterium]